MRVAWFILVACLMLFGVVGCPAVDPGLQEPATSQDASPDGTQTAESSAESEENPDTQQAEEGVPERSKDAPPPEGPVGSGLQAKIDAFVKQEMQKQDLVGVAIGVVQGGKVTYTKGYGWANKEKSIPVEAATTMFRWASVAKTLAAIVALQLSAKGKLDLKQDISEIYKEYVSPADYVEKCTGGTKEVGGVTYTCEFGFFTIPIAPDARKISTQMLLGHLAGIPHYTNGKGNPTPPKAELNDPSVNTGIEWAMKYLVNKPLVAPPGEKYSYSTFGFNLAGVVLEKATGSAFADLVKEGILKPAQMTTMQPDYEWKSIPHRAVGYLLANLPEGSDDVSWKLPGGGYISTVVDMAKYCRALTDETLLTDALKQLAWKAQVPRTGRSSYGMGFGVGRRKGRRLISHTGSQQKARTHLRLYPDERLCIVVMSNSTWASTSPFVSGIEDLVRP